jgi:hypothetical protein
MGGTVTISTLHLECGSAAAAFETKAAAALPHSKYFVRVRDIWTIFSHDRSDA